jgi:hypothetical protein
MVKMNKETEYKKDLNELKEQILKEGNALLTKRDLLERFCKIDKEYKGRPWNLLQILANINILIGQEPCEDAISRTQALSDYADWYGYGYRENTFYKLLKDMPSVTPKPKTWHWIPVSERLPQLKEQVLCCEKDKVFIGRMVFEHDGIPVFSTPHCNYYYVTAWMPLPTLYEPQRSKNGEKA